MTDPEKLAAELREWREAHADVELRGVNTEAAWSRSFEATHKLLAVADALLAALEDTARLDWLEARSAHGWSLQDWRPEYTEVYFLDDGRTGEEKPTPCAETLRAAIDAARSKGHTDG